MVFKHKRWLSAGLAALMLATPALAQWTVTSAGPGDVIKVAQDGSGLLGVSCFTPEGTLLVNSQSTLKGFDKSGGAILTVINTGGNDKVELFGYVIGGKTFISNDSKKSAKAIGMLRRASQVELQFTGENYVSLGTVKLSGSSKAIRQLPCQ